MFSRTVTTWATAGLLLIGALVVAANPCDAGPFSTTKYVGTYVLNDGHTGTVAIEVIRMVNGGWEGLALVDGRKYFSNATTGASWSVAIFSLDSQYQQHVVATMKGTLSEDGSTLTGVFTLKGLGGRLTLTGQ